MNINSYRQLQIDLGIASVIACFNDSDWRHENLFQPDKWCICVKDVYSMSTSIYLVNLTKEYEVIFQGSSRLGNGGEMGDVFGTAMKIGWETQEVTDRTYDSFKLEGIDLKALERKMKLWLKEPTLRNPKRTNQQAVYDACKHISDMRGGYPLLDELRRINTREHYIK